MSALPRRANFGSGSQRDRRPAPWREEAPRSQTGQTGRWSLLRAPRALAPAGGPIAHRVVLASLSKSVAEAIRGSTEPEDLHRQLTDLTTVKTWLFTDSGRSALSLVLMTLRALYPDRDEVLIPAYTSYSVPAAVVRAGLRVRLCDIEAETLGLCPVELERRITPRTLCIVPDHLFGIPCRIHAICEIARERGLPVVEDAAQAMGILCQGRPGGSFGRIAIFSSSRGKCLSASGGGLIGTNDEELMQACRQRLDILSMGTNLRMGWRSAIEAELMTLFIYPRFYWLPAALPFLKLGQSIFDPTFPIARMSRFQRALIGRLLPELASLREGRREQAWRLREAFGESMGRRKVRMLWPKDGDEGAFLRLPVLIRDEKKRNVLLHALQCLGLGVTAGYPLPLSKVPGLKPYLTNSDPPVATADLVSRQLLTFPTHAWVSDRDRQQMAEMVMECA